MRDSELPEDLQRVADAVLTRSAAPVPPRLRTRVLDAVHLELLRRRSRDRWSFAARVAAVAVLGFHLVFAASHGDVTLSPGGGVRRPIAELATAIRDTVPELTPSEASRQALLLRGARCAMPWAAPRGYLAVPEATIPALQLSPVENESWDMLFSGFSRWRFR